MFCFNCIWYEMFISSFKLFSFISISISWMQNSVMEKVVIRFPYLSGVCHVGFLSPVGCDRPTGDRKSPWGVGCFQLNIVTVAILYHEIGIEDNW